MISYASASRQVEVTMIRQVYRCSLVRRRAVINFKFISVQGELALGNPIRKPPDRPSKIRMWTKVTLQTVEPQDDIPELSGFVRHPKTLERCTVFNNFRRRPFGVLKREEINDRPIFNFPEDGLLG